MSRVEEVEQAIRKLTPEEFAQVAQWIQSMDDERWDSQLDRDAAAGKLDFLRDEAREEKRNGSLQDWPPSS